MDGWVHWDGRVRSTRNPSMLGERASPPFAHRVLRSNRFCVCSSYYFLYFLVLLSRRDGWAGARGDREPREEDCFDFHSRPTNPPPQAKACLAGDVRIHLLGRHPSACHCQSHSRFPTLDRPASPQALVSGSAAMTATSSSSPSRSVSAVPRQDRRGVAEQWQNLRRRTRRTRAWTWATTGENFLILCTLLVPCFETKAEITQKLRICYTRPRRLFWPPP